MSTTKSKSIDDSSSGLTGTLKFLTCVGGIYGCYLTYGVLQEDLLKKYVSEDGEKFTDTLFLLFIQVLINAFFAYIMMLIAGRSGDQIPVTSFLYSGTTYILAMLFSNEALRYVSYPTQALGKSCKMIPVMAFGVLINREKHSFIEYLSVITITVGITFFQLAGPAKKVSSNDTLYGTVLLFASLCMDGMTGAIQNKMKKICKPTVHEFMFFTNIAATGILTIGVVGTGQIFSGLQFSMKNPEVIPKILLFSLCSAFGQNFIFMTIKNYDPLICTTMTTTRKFFTILISVVAYGNELTQNQWIAVGLVFIGLVGEIYAKQQKKKGSKKNPTA